MQEAANRRGRLEDHVAVVTGAAGGIGLATAKRLAQDGANVVMVDLDDEGVHEAAASLMASGLKAVARTVDVTNTQQVDTMFELVGADLGRLDILVNAAGILRDSTVGEMTDEQWDASLNTNLKSVFLCCRAAQRLMLPAGEGSIINLSSRAAYGNPRQGNYGAAKAGIRALTRTLAMELGPSGIRVNSVTPGYIATPMADRAAREAGLDPAEHQARAAQQIFLRRVGQPDEIADAIAFIASDDARFVTGANIPVNGGI
jgi:3-oxoacyl-[acyl-carrier protein] reductase